MTQEERDAVMAKNGIRPMSQVELDARRAQRDLQEGKTFPGQRIAEPINDYDTGRVWSRPWFIVGLIAMAVSTALMILGPLLVAMWVWEKLS